MFCGIIAIIYLIKSVTMQLTQVATKTDVAVKVANAIAIVALVVAIASTVGPIVRGAANFAASTTADTITTNFTCRDTDGGKVWQRKGTTTANTIRGPRVDSCMDSQVLIENFCDQTRQAAGAVRRNCLNGCSNGACLGTSTPPVATSTASIAELSSVSWATSRSDTNGTIDFFFTLTANNGSFYFNTDSVIDTSSSTFMNVNADNNDSYSGYGLVARISGTATDNGNGIFTIPQNSSARFRIRYVADMAGVYEALVRGVASQTVSSINQLSPTMIID